MEAFVLSSMPPNAENCTTGEASSQYVKLLGNAARFAFEFTCRIGRMFIVGLAECKLNSSPINGFTFLLHFSGVPSGIKRFLRNSVIFPRMQTDRKTPRSGYTLEKMIG